MSSVHQIVIRKDGPIHGITYTDGAYTRQTLCGLKLSGLEHPKRRRFETAKPKDQCGRCQVSFRS